jgi:hypothetical protein
LDTLSGLSTITCLEVDQAPRGLRHQHIFNLKYAVENLCHVNCGVSAGNFYKQLRGCFLSAVTCTTEKKQLHVQTRHRKVKCSESSARYVAVEPLTRLDSLTHLGFASSTPLCRFVSRGNKVQFTVSYHLLHNRHKWTSGVGRVFTVISVDHS